MPNYLLLITLEGTTDPEIYRLLSIPKTYSFHDLHRAIQTSFGWANCHLYKFAIMDAIDEDPTGSLRNRKRYLQLWRDPKDSVRGSALAAGSVALSHVFDNQSYKDKDVEYEYDFGDRWTHSIEFVGWGRDDTEGRVVCYAGQGHGPAEDAGGIDGWEAVVEAYTARRPNREQKELRRWYEKECSNKDPQGLSAAGGAWRWNREYVNWDLQQLEFRPVAAAGDSQGIESGIMPLLD